MVGGPLKSAASLAICSWFHPTLTRTFGSDSHKPIDNTLPALRSTINRAPLKPDWRFAEGPTLSCHSRMASSSLPVGTSPRTTLAYTISHPGAIRRLARARSRRETQLLQSRQSVNHIPVFDDQAIIHPGDVDLGRFGVLTRRGDPQPRGDRRVHVSTDQVSLAETPPSHHTRPRRSNAARDIGRRSAANLQVRK